MPDPIRVLLADDEALFREGLTALLDGVDGIEVVGTAGSGDEAVEAAARLHPDVVVMDVRMPGLDGVAATRLLVADEFPDRGPDTVRVLVLSGFHEEGVVPDALRAGASGFLLKSAAGRDLHAAIRVVAGGDAWLDPPVAARLIHDFAARPDPSRRTPQELAALTPREREVLTLLAHGAGTAQIAGHLVIGEATVKTHVARVLMKLGLRDRAEAVAAAYKSGLVDPADLPPSPRGG